MLGVSLCPELRPTIVAPSGGGWGRAIVREFKATVGTHWAAEMTNPNTKTVAVSFFIFLACISPAITFGALYDKSTHGWMGAVEMILATAWCGIVYALLGGQPMMINGGTGPVLAFIGVLYQLWYMRSEAREKAKKREATEATKLVGT